MSLLSEFFGNNTETMNTSVERFDAPSLRGVPVQPVYDFYEGFHYPYSPMQRTKRFPKIINAYALQERANADVQGFINHKILIDDLIDRVTALEDYEYTERFEIRQLATRASSFANGASDTLQQDITMQSNEDIIGIRAVYVLYGNNIGVASGFRVNSYGFTVTNNNNAKDVLLKVSITNQSGQSYSNVYANVIYSVYKNMTT